MKVYLISDTHFNHYNIATYCNRPADFNTRIIKQWQACVKLRDLVIHLGDVFIGKASGWQEICTQLPGRKVLIRGNHDRQRSVTWWMENGFEFACDGLEFRGHRLTHEPLIAQPSNGALNLHGHLHNVWHGFGAKEFEGLRYAPPKWRRLFAVEYTNYSPVEYDKFIAHPTKYLAIGPPAGAA